MSALLDCSNNIGNGNFLPQDCSEVLLVSKYNTLFKHLRCDEDVPHHSKLIELGCDFSCGYDRCITDLNEMKNTLKVLYCDGDSCITQEDIKELQLEELDCNGNRNITDVSHMKNTLKKLYCDGSSGITQEGIKELQLEELDCNGNRNITDVSHMKNTLKKLYCAGDSGITQESIKELQLEELECSGNRNITDVSHMKNTLKKLYCVNSGITEKWIKGLNPDTVIVM